MAAMIGLRRRAVDRRVGERAGLRAVEHLGVDLGGGDGHRGTPRAARRRYAPILPRALIRRTPTALAAGPWSVRHGDAVTEGGLAEHVPADPRVHRDRRGRAGVDRAGRAELRDRQHAVAGRPRLRRTAPGPPARTAGRSARGSVVRLQRHRPGQVVDAEHAAGPPTRPRRASVGDVGVVAHVLVAVGDHRAAAVPATAGRRCAPRRRGTRWRCARPSRC